MKISKNQDKDEKQNNAGIFEGKDPVTQCGISDPGIENQVPGKTKENQRLTAIENVAKRSNGEIGGLRIDRRQ
jgi:hypothetical protein